ASGLHSPATGGSRCRSHATPSSLDCRGSRFGGRAMTLFAFAVLSFVLVGGLTFAVGALLLRLLPAFREERLTAPAAGAGNASVSILRWQEGTAGDWRNTV